MSNRKKKGFLYHHSLSIASIALLILWIILYARGNEHTHWGAFFGNAIADWTGVVVTVLGTKYFYEIGSAESRRLLREPTNRVLKILVDHSLVLFLLITGAGWVAYYISTSPETKWGSVVGNIVSEWTQIIGLVLLTKRLIEQHSKESK
jgi:hypothetical protein